ncbi:hypothetical protein Godav_005171 [Gossypium davidsonii]|uniref:Disease resistance protein winged helix domain-containing protein n=1 Tax=Gossypium davidsonii TaxID=34287 RepID=A0A7J8TBN8_GOSDV|nr:hypothetical protein [Gossypium davidsonii]
MANGLLEHPKQNQEREDVGKRYLNELLPMCLIQMEVEVKFHLYFTFRMHDLVHDLALDVSQKECKTVNSETETVDENIRYLLLCDEKLVGVPRVLEEMKNVRTVIIQDALKESKTTHESLINLCLSNFKYLRALEVRKSPLMALPNSIGTLKHLQVLDLVGCRSIRELPRNAVLSFCTELVSLPRSLKFLSKLEHLEIFGCLRINLRMELEEEEDKDLQLTLKTFSLFGLDALTDLPRLLLQGSSSTLQQLRIMGCRNLSVLPVWLLNLTSLHKLQIVGCRNLSALPEGIYRLTMQLLDVRS